MKTNVIHRITGSLLLLAGLGLFSASASGQTDADKKKDDPLLTEAIELLSKNKGAEAKKKYDEAVAKNPSLPPWELVLTRISLANQGKNSRQLMELCLAKYPNHPEVYLQNASIAMSEGRLAEAMMNLQNALNFTNMTTWTRTQRNTFKKEANRGLAAVYERRGDWHGVRQALEALVDLPEANDPQIQLILAKARFMTGQENEALDALKEAYKLDQERAAKDKSDPNLDLPEVLLAQFQSGKAEAGKDKDDTDKKKVANRAATVKLFEKAEEKYAGKAKPMLAYASWLLDRGQLNEAKEKLNAAIKAEPSSTDKSVLRQKAILQGMIARYEKNYPDAEKKFYTLWLENPNDSYAANQAALALIEQKDDAQKKRAVAFAELNVRLNEQAAEPRATLGWCYFNSKRYDEAEKQLDLAVSSGQVTPDTAYYHAELRAHRGKNEDAYKDLKIALDSKDGVFVNRERAEVLFKTVSGLLKPGDREKLDKEIKDAEQGATPEPPPTPKPDNKGDGKGGSGKGDGKADGKP